MSSRRDPKWQLASFAFTLAQEKIRTDHPPELKEFLLKFQLEQAAQLLGSRPPLAQKILFWETRLSPVVAVTNWVDKRLHLTEGARPNRKEFVAALKEIRGAVRAAQAGIEETFRDLAK